MYVIFWLEKKYMSWWLCIIHNQYTYEYTYLPEYNHYD